MEVLFATNNPAKIKIYSNKLKEKGINIKSLVDLNIKVDIEESGKDSKDNEVVKFILESLN